VIHPDLLAILACPDSRQPLALADEATLTALNARIAGAEVAVALEAGLIREDGQVLYPVRDDIPVLLREEGIAVHAAG
jgi:uncharacterized protein YbaR (Trm112 family)